ncbi:hypothetical protein TSUD_237760 [Trifolium subterraneum]|uniref:Uncharacterized protein n=1 Tax=Trifolium subterraneum TaxID=3900 RepID=A0A2Z6MCU8_TRISU|nr:hypothetical protein TSUD_237760 [Trifolium subterraneum]
MAMYSLKMVISELKEDSPFCISSGIVRVEVPIEERVEAIDWLHSQGHLLLPRCYFSRREQKFVPGKSIAGVGSAVCFSQPQPFSYWDWMSIRR